MPSGHPEQPIPTASWSASLAVGTQCGLRVGTEQDPQGGTDSKDGGLSGNNVPLINRFQNELASHQAKGTLAPSCFRLTPGSEVWGWGHWHGSALTLSCLSSTPFSWDALPEGLQKPTWVPQRCHSETPSLWEAEMPTHLGISGALG